MSIKLFSHNKIAYEAAVNMINRTGKAAVIHPTGTGKSFIGFKLAEENPDKNICWLSPSEYIVKVQVENLNSEIGKGLSNIKFITYAKLMIMNDDEIKAIDADFIVLDEFHRCGAEMWSKGIERLLAFYENVGLLGLSATNIRYLDNQRDMAAELFDGKIASEITLGEAIVRGIIKPPKYVTAIYSYKSDMEKYEQRVDSISNSGVKNECRKYLDKLRRRVENAEGLDEIFFKHIKNKTGKYIVFCANKSHMDELISQVPELFGKIDNSPAVYCVYNEVASSAKEFRNFKQDNSNRLKLLFCIDMLNEGIHIDGISGVILFRPTVSPVIYKQQIGRALSAGTDTVPVIFDIVNNFQNLYTISSIQREVAEAVTYYRNLGREEEIINDSFYITDELKDCREIFEGLEKCLSATWEINYNSARKYFEENGHLNVPKRYVTNDGISLGQWLTTQRRVKNGAVAGTLTAVQIEKLNNIGMIWDNKRELAWESAYLCAKEYFEENGNLDVAVSYVCDNGFKLGTWISNIRQQKISGKAKNVLTAERINRLEQIGMIWSKFDYQWEKNYEAAARYYMKNGHLNIPVKFADENGIRLGAWIRGLRASRAKEDKLTAEQIERLDNIGMVWSGKFEVDWERHFEAAKAYFKEHGDLNVPATFVTDTGMRLGKWLYNQKSNKNIDEDRKRRLEEIGMKPIVDSWQERYELAKKYFEENGNLNIAHDYKTKSGIWLGKWLYEQRKNKKKLTPDQYERLTKIGMEWRTPAELSWQNNYNEAKEYYQIHGNTNITLKYKTQTGLCLGLWLSRQRKMAQAGKLSAEQITLLAGIEA